MQMQIKGRSSGEGMQLGQSLQIKRERREQQKKLDYLPLMRYGIGTFRDNQRTRLSLIWINCVWKMSVDNKALVLWPSGDFRATA